ncbi:MAG TPA: Ppx/GppA phosphatase family protein [Acetobacteraceae bacterium]|nr:Ppx/GppA phosphatase family protein [Acetobacteraceae bacterium]
MAGTVAQQTEGGQFKRDHRTNGASFAAIDLGTNNCRLLVGTPTQEGFRVVDSFSRIVRLGEGLHSQGRLSPSAMDRAIAALHAITSRLAKRPVHGLRAVATEACRQAANGSEFLARAQAETGLRFDLISTREEAELALESCAPLLKHQGRRALLFDIGGGSTELAWVRLGGPAPELIGYDSLPIGVVSLAERFGPAGFTQDGFQAMVDDVKVRLRAFESIHCIAHETRLGGVRLLGTSGTVTTLAGVALKLARYRRPLVDGTVLSAEAADQALAVLRGLGRHGLAVHPCVGPERVEFVLPGCAVFQAIRETWPMAEVTVADRGLREGMLLRMMRQARHRGYLPIRRPHPGTNRPLPA